MNGEPATSTEPSAMTAHVAPIADSPKVEVATWAVRAAAAWNHFEIFLIRAGEWLNPILVKETRQALKSFQFTITFVLVLVACWVVTIGGVAVIGPRIFYSADGGTLLFWYYAVLAFPLYVVVPYAAFRSLAAEREDNTYELLSITTLKPRQIIIGKLASSVVQMAVYFSAIAPCIAFTYLLRGVDVPTILVLLTYTFFLSLGLSMFAILLATVCQQRFAQVFVSVALVAFLIWVFFVSVVGLAVNFIQYNHGVGVDGTLGMFSLAVATLYTTSFALAYFAAAGMITFTSANRSTPLRICMLVQQAAFLGWIAYAWISDDFQLESLVFMALFAAVYWYAMGTMLTAERPAMSQRVKRHLPSSFLGRVFFSWLNPGPASGYMFVVANAATIVIAGLLAMAFALFIGKAPGNWTQPEELVYLLIIGWGYLVGYLGIGMLVVAALRKIAEVTMLATVLIHFLVVLAGSGIPTTIHLMTVELRNLDYTLLQITNPVWSLKYLAEGGLPAEANVLLLTVPAAGICALLLNLPGVLREMHEMRLALPQRIVEDEAELHPVASFQPNNPWDEP